jgi:DNA-binding transcriptional LysR family regulator
MPPRDAAERRHGSEGAVIEAQRLDVAQHVEAGRTAWALIAAELVQYPLILDVGRGRIAQQMRRWFEDGGVTPQPAMELNAHEAIKKLIAGGFGAAILPRTATTGTDGFIVREFDPPLPWQVALIRHRNKGPDTALDIVSDALLRASAHTSR